MAANPGDINETIARALEMEEKGTGKLVPLAEAIGRYVKPGMQLHLACGLGGPGAAICEIIRQYSGKEPGFTIIMSALAGHINNLVHNRLAKKLIFTATAGGGKSRKEIQKAFAEGTIEFENWSLCSLQQRLMAGAMGLPFMPSRSIIGSDMAEDNAASFRTIEDPFGSGASIGLVEALKPDISIVHGFIADVHGNTITAAPYGDDIWGPLASTGGVIVTVEKIVPSSVIKRYASLVKIPGHMVKAVAEAPLGTHPFALLNPGIADLQGYSGDRHFMQELQAATEADKLDDWIKEWVLDCKTHDDYLKKLGEARISALRGISAGKPPKQSGPAPQTPVTGYTDDEMMSIAAAREVIRSTREHGHRTILAGAGAGLMAAWLAWYQLRAAGHEIDLLQGNGQIGYTPQPAALRAGGKPDARMMTDAITTHGVLVGGANNKCVSLLGAGEIDKYGNINSTRNSAGLFLSGSGGANDAANASEVIIVVQQAQRRFVEKLPFITSPGKNVSRVISSMGIYEKGKGQDELKLAACYPDDELPELAARIGRIQENCGWEIRQSPGIQDVPAPAKEELELLRALGPATLA